MEQITSVTNIKIKNLLSLRKKSERYNERKFLVEGLHLTVEAYKNNLLETVLSTDESLLKQFDDAKQILVSDAVINKLSTTTTPQNIIGVVKMKESLFRKSNQYVVLDDVNDPGNFGTIIRTSLALGVKDIIVSPNTVDEYNEKTLRATQGAIFKANIIRMNLEDAYKKFNDYLKARQLAKAKNNETNVDEIVNVEESENIDEHPIEVYKKPGIEEDDGKEDNKPFSIS